MKNIIYTILLASTLTQAQNNNIFTSSAKADGFAWVTTGPIEVPLPVEYLSFNVYVRHIYVILDWTTATEMNNSHFVVERSVNGYSFEELTTVEGSGNSSVPIDYTATDENPLSRRMFYRLKQVDYNGQYTYSPIKVIYITEGSRLLDDNNHYNTIGQQIK
jgi:hypothetical protein